MILVTCAPYDSIECLLIRLPNWQSDVYHAGSNSPSFQGVDFLQRVRYRTVCPSRASAEETAPMARPCPRHRGLRHLHLRCGESGERRWHRMHAADFVRLWVCHKRQRTHIPTWLSAVHIAAHVSVEPAETQVHWLCARADTDNRSECRISAKLVRHRDSPHQSDPLRTFRFQMSPINWMVALLKRLQPGRMGRSSTGLCWEIGHSWHGRP